MKGGGHAVPGDVVFILYDIYGRAVKQQPVINNETIINRGNLANGIYLYKLIDQNETVGTGKLIIE